MKFLIWNITRANPAIAIDELTELNKLLKIEQKARTKAEKQVQINKAKHDEALKQAKATAEVQKLTKQKQKANIALQHLAIAEKMNDRLDIPGVSKTRRAELNAAITARTENVVALGFKCEDISGTITKLEKLVNGN